MKPAWAVDGRGSLPEDNRATCSNGGPARDGSGLRPETR
jgi:hypothetical protein